jgi:hypothetical protein
MTLRCQSALSRNSNSAAAGHELGSAVRSALGGDVPDALVVFASSQHDYVELLQAAAAASGCQVLVGSSSAGEFTDKASGTGWASALGLSSKSMVFSIGVGEGVACDPTGAARSVVSGFEGMKIRPHPFRSALVMTDALAGHADQVVEELTVATGGNYSFFGGGAGDDGNFSRTHVFAGTRALTNAVVALEIQSLKPIGIGVSHGWQPAGPALRVTESHGATIVSLNGVPAVHAFEEHAALLGVSFDVNDPMPFMLHNVLGIEDQGQYRLRVPLAIRDDGAVVCAAPIPQGSVVRLMRTTAESAVAAAEQAARAAMAAIGGAKPGGALVFDCVATRLRIGRGFDDELNACASLLAPAIFAGCNTYGQIARAEGQFGGFHNCTAVVCVFPE